jgi:hypothetical protein
VCQIAKKNDLVTEKSVWTEDQIKKTADWDTRFNLGNFDNLSVWILEVNDEVIKF